MKFIIHNIKIWLKNAVSNPIDLEFANNKVNVITGDSTTGKSSIFAILDYCLLSVNNNIPDEISGNSSWFGIKVTIDENDYWICRKAPRENIASDEVYFEMIDDTSLPMWNRIDEPKSTGHINLYRDALNNKFNVDKLHFNYRDLFLYSFLTENIISDQFHFLDVDYVFDSYKEQDVIDNLYRFISSNFDEFQTKVLEKEDLENQLTKIKNHQKEYEKKLKKYSNTIEDLFQQCILKHIISTDYREKTLSLEDKEVILLSLLELKGRIARNETDETVEKLERERKSLIVRKKIYDRYKRQYNRYCQMLSRDEDSLRPILNLEKYYDMELLHNSISDEFICHLKKSLLNIREDLERQETFSLEGFEKNYSIIRERIKTIEEDLAVLKNDNELLDNSYYFELGKLIRDIEFEYSQKPVLKYSEDDIFNLYSKLKVLENIESLKGKQCDWAKGLLEEKTTFYFKQLYSIDNKYKEYLTVLRNRRLVVKNPNSDFVVKNLGSKSNYMFLHICFFLGFHDLLLRRVTNMPSVLFIDQPSLPYYKSSNDDVNISNSDEEKLLNIFKILNDFIDRCNNELHTDFQIILVEHAPEELWKNNNLIHFETKKIFRKGSGLLPQYLFEGQD